MRYADESLSVAYRECFSGQASGGGSVIDIIL